MKPKVEENEKKKYAKKSDFEVRLLILCGLVEQGKMTLPEISMKVYGSAKYNQLGRVFLVLQDMIKNDVIVLSKTADGMAFKAEIPSSTDSEALRKAVEHLVNLAK
jgi:hypothetical protein